MGLIALITVGGFLAAAFVLVALFLAMGRNLWRTGLAWPLKLLTILATLPLFALPALGLWKVFNGSDMLYMRGFFGLAPKTERIFRFPLEGNETLAVKVRLDFNTGAKGGASVGYRFVDERAGQAFPIGYERGVCPFRPRPYYKKVIRLPISEKPEAHKSYEDVCLDLYFDPTLFREHDFKRLVRFLTNNHAAIEGRINDYLDHREAKIYERMWLRDAYFLAPGALRKTYRCEKGVMLRLRPDGRLSAKGRFGEKVRIFDVGRLVEEGRALELLPGIEAFRQGDAWTLRKGEWVVRGCRDKEGADFFANLSVRMASPSLR